MTDKTYKIREAIYNCIVNKDTKQVETVDYSSTTEIMCISSPGSQTEFQLFVVVTDHPQAKTLQNIKTLDMNIQRDISTALSAFFDTQPSIRFTFSQSNEQGDLYTSTHFEPNKIPDNPQS